MFFFPNVFIVALKSVDASILMAKELLMLSRLLKLSILFCSAVLKFMSTYDI